MILEETAALAKYALLDSGEGYRLEKFGEYVLARPDPAVLWKKSLPEAAWLAADATYTKSGEEHGTWQKSKPMPEHWLMQHSYKNVDIAFFAKLTPFKHTGVFAEQAANWNFVIDYVEKHGMQNSSAIKPKLLNLFGYTGIASIVAAKLGYAVTHVDASKPSLGWAKENMHASQLPDDAIRWIMDDCLKFVKREEKRGVKYAAIILDPPAFGRGAKGEVWKFNESMPELLGALAKICTAQNDFHFLIANAYAVSVSSLLLKNLMDDFIIQANLGARQVDYGELVLMQAPNNAKEGDSHNLKRLLSTGIFSRIY